ncbi:unnamed protein product [Schistocephalus solidus]|uniref:Uncharacterized protein n=1 Tax=Schistocephalus solidus TaxID=70667 RepID=A0A183TRF9_SCHSO|nr:unnamed protein product [Schistocephalus solidus]
MAIDDEFFKTTFIERLQTSVQMILPSGLANLDISKFAETTNLRMEVKHLSTTSVTQASEPLTASMSDLAMLKAQIAQLSATVATLQLRRSADPTQKSRSLLQFCQYDGPALNRA